MPKVSVIVPIYNVEKYLDRCMESLLNQTLKDIEIIMVDDGSPDKSPQMCDEYAKKDRRIKVVHKKNGGLSDARNAGLKVATGEYVAFVDSDDYQSLNTYEELYRQAKSGDYDVVYGGAFWNKSNGEFFELFKIDRSFKGKEVLTLLGDMLYQDGNRPFEEQVSMSVWTGIYKLDVINKNNISFKSERIYISEDVIFHMELLPLCKSIKCVPKAYYHYCFNKDSLTHNFNFKKVECNFRLYEKMCEIVERYGLKELDSKVAHFFLKYTRGIILKEILLSSKGLSDKRQYCRKVYNYPAWSKVIKILKGEKLETPDRLACYIISHKAFLVNYLVYKVYYSILGKGMFT